MNFNPKKIFSLETLVIILIICFAIIAPITNDDGWNFIIFDNYLKSGNLVLLGFDVNANFSRISYILQANLLYHFNYSFTQFIYSVFFSLIGFYAVFKLVKLHFNGAEKVLFYNLYVLFFFSTFYILRTRPEVVYANLILVLFYLLSINLNQKISVLHSFLISIILAFAISAHPNGVFGLIILLIYLFESRKNLPNIFTIMLAFFSLIFFTTIFTFYKISFSEFISSVKKLSEDSGHSVPFYKEYIRYIYFYYNNKELFILFLPILAILVKYKRLLWVHLINLYRTNSYFLFSFKCLVSGFLFLSLNPAKWDTYFILLLLFLVNLIVYFSSILSKKEQILFISFTSILILFSWMNTLNVNEASILNRVLKEKHFESLNEKCRELVYSNDIVFVQNGVYPLFRSYSKVDIFWQISSQSDENIPHFVNKKLVQLEPNIGDFAIVSEQRNLDQYYKVRITDSLKFNAKLYYIYLK